jgi:hypothetical protein
MMHHLDKRAATIVAAAADEDGRELLSTDEAAAWLGVSTSWLEIGRHKGWGPPFVVLTARMVRYERHMVLTWLRERTHQCTNEYRPRKTKVA